jgi:hypothetical protein
MIYPVKIKKITSPYGKRLLNGVIPSQHKGVDFSGSNDYALAVCDMIIKKVVLPYDKYPCLFEYNTKSGKFDKIKGIPNYRAWTPYIIAEPIEVTENKITFVYKHVRATVPESFIVNEGENIADIGNFGYSMGKHLHFEVLINNKNVNPIDFLEGKVK